MILFIDLVSNHKRSFIPAIGVSIVCTRKLLSTTTKFLGMYTVTFLGHRNDAQTYNLMEPIGPNENLVFPADCRLLADKVYPCKFHLLRKYKTSELRGRAQNSKRKCKRLNKKIGSRRIFVEHAARNL